MKTKIPQRRRSLLVSGGLFLALLLSAFPDICAEDRGAGSPVVEAKDNVKRNEQPKEPETSYDNIHLVGPSSAEIHDFLYPAPNDGKVVKQAN